MRVLVIGGTGFIGRHTVHELVRLGHDVTVFHRGESQPALPDNVRHVYGDRDDLVQHQASLLDFPPDVVVDIISYTAGHARQLSSLFRGKAGRIVALSSADVYRNYDGFRGESTYPPDPVPLPVRA